MLIPNTPVIAARPGRKKDLPGQGLLFSLEDQDSPAKPVPVKAAPNPLAAMSDRWSPRIEIVRFAVENNRDRIESSLLIVPDSAICSSYSTGICLLV